MRSRALAAAAVLAALAAAAPARAADNAGVTAEPILQVPLGARALGMGGAFTAVANDATALQYNPAGLARLSAQEADFTYIVGAGDTTLQHFAYAGPTPLTGISGNGYTSAAASLLLSQSGTIQYNQLGAGGALVNSETLNAGSDLVITAGYAERVGSTPVEYGDSSYNIDHFFGVGGEYIHSSLVQAYTATAYAANLGYLVQSPETGLSLGLAALNLGNGLRYADVTDPLPATGRAGLAWQGGVPSVHDVTAAADGEYVVAERVLHLDVGVEYFWMKTYGMRIGYQFNQGDQSGLTIGVGYRWRNTVLFDYAYDIGDLLGNAQRVTLTYRFGEVPPSVRSRQRRPFIETSPEHQELLDLDQRPAQPENPPQTRPVQTEEQGAPGWIY